MKKNISLAICTLLLLLSCKKESTNSLDYFKSSEKGVKNGGVKLVRIATPKGKMTVWTKRIGNNPKMKLLLLTGGPGLSHEYMECMESFLPAEGIEIIYYDQLGTGFSDNPNDIAMWELDRYVDEVEQVRKVLNLDKNNFFVLGHSWGGILAMQYALKYQQNLKGLIISNMMASCPEYGKYSEVLAAQMPPEILKRIKAIEAEKDYNNPKYMELLRKYYYSKHICRIPLHDWPEPVNRGFKSINSSLYLTMQGPSELGISGKLTNWDVSKSLKSITVPTLVIGAKYDTMDPKYMQWMANEVQNGSYLYCSNGSHMSLYDDQEVYMNGLIKFIKKNEQ
jgi:proline iminopeptidase